MANEVLWGITNAILRAAGLLFLHQILRINGRKEFQWRSLMVVNVLHALALVLATITICHPMAAAWDASIDGTCGNQTASYLTLEILGALIDIVILILPLPTVARLPESPTRRIGIGLLLSASILYVVSFSQHKISWQML